MKTKIKILICSLLFMGVLFLLTNSCKKENDSIPFETGIVTDIEGNVYKTVKIGNQWWMAENLRATKYRNGDTIPNVTDGNAWGNLTTGAYCDYDNSPGNSTTYGKLYNWHAVNDSRNIAPDGWHVSSHNEWANLMNYLGGVSVAGGKLKEADTIHWQSPNTGATNETGFTALPAGYRAITGNFVSLGINAIFWSSTECDGSIAWEWGLGIYSFSLYCNPFEKSSGYSVRCLKDN